MQRDLTSQAATAVIDIGSNSVRMVIFVGPDIVFNQRELCSLGKDIPATQKLYQEGVKKATAALKKYVSEFKTYNVKHVIAVATAALRDAQDGADFIDFLKSKLGLDVKIISGEQEAYYASVGIMSEHRNAQGLVADLGGGSLECARIAMGNVYEKISLPLGAQRLLSYGDKAPEMTHTILKLLPPAMIPSQTLYVIGGSWRALANAFLDDANQPKSDFSGLTLPAERIISFAERIARMDSERLVRNYRMEPARAILLPVSAALLIAVIEHVQAKTIIISKSGIRDGIYYDFVTKGERP